MKTRKKLLLVSLILLFCCFAVVACRDLAEQSATQKSEPDEVTSLRLQLEFYQSRVTTLESELTAAKVQLYLQRSEYEKMLALLESDVELPDQTPEVFEPTPVWFHEEREDGILITGVTGASARLEIPATLDGKAVVTIGESAFAGGAFSTVVLPDGVREIGWFAFSGCTNLASVLIPASVEKIGYGAFENCSKSLQFVCTEDSFAAAFARSYGYAVKIE